MPVHVLGDAEQAPLKGGQLAFGDPAALGQRGELQRRLPEVYDAVGPSPLGVVGEVVPIADLGDRALLSSSRTAPLKCSRAPPSGSAVVLIAVT